MRVLLDTHRLVWTAEETERLSAVATARTIDPANDLFFSVVSLWKLVVKIGLGRSVIRGDVRRSRKNLLPGNYREPSVTADHAFAVGNLPPIHADPFDRLLVVQTHVEGLRLLTADAVVARYPGAIMKV